MRFKCFKHLQMSTGTAAERTLFAARVAAALCCTAASLAPASHQ